jgi:hypothetical protein
MGKRTAVTILATALASFGFAGGAQAARGHGGHAGAGAHFSGHAGGFHHGGVRHFHGPAFRSSIFIGGAVAAPYFYPPPYYAYPPPYYAPPPQTYWYCPAFGAYYPAVQQCPGGWQPVVQ